MLEPDVAQAGAPAPAEPPRRRRRISQKTTAVTASHGAAPLPLEPEETAVPARSAPDEMAVPRRPTPNAVTASPAAPDYGAAFIQAAMGILSPSEQKSVATSVQAKTWVFSSACSGSGMGEIAHQCLMESQGCDARVAFTCESVARKRQFYVDHVHPNVGGTTCVFDDIVRLSDGETWCHPHARKCAVPGASDFFVCGFSCKDLSRASSKRTMEAKQSLLSSGTGTSGHTFQGLVSHVALARPAVVVLENVDELVREGSASENYQYLKESFDKLGYAGDHDVFLSSDYLLPQKRKRVYFVFFNTEAFGWTREEAGEMAHRCLAQAASLQVPCGSVRQLLLRPQSPMLAKVLQEKQANAVGPDPLMPWRAQHATFFRNHGLNWRHLTPTPAMKASPWFALLPPREKEIAIYGAHLAESTPGVFSIDVSQRLGRTPLGSGEALPTILPGAKTYLLRENRLLLGVEALRAQGFPTQWVEEALCAGSVSDHFLHDLAGNAFSLTVLLAVLIGIHDQLGGTLPKPCEATSSCSLPDFLLQPID